MLAWMALTSGPSAAAGIILGRRLEHRNAYRTGVEVGRMMTEYDQANGGITATEMLRRARAESGNQHGHPGPCNHEKGCW